MLNTKYRRIAEILFWVVMLGIPISIQAGSAEAALVFLRIWIGMIYFLALDSILSIFSFHPRNKEFPTDKKTKLVAEMFFHLGVQQGIKIMTEALENGKSELAVSEKFEEEWEKVLKDWNKKSPDDIIEDGNPLHRTDDPDDFTKVPKDY